MLFLVEYLLNVFEDKLLSENVLRPKICFKILFYT